MWPTRYMQIIDEYYYGHYEYYNLIMRNYDGYFNASEMCSVRNLSFEDWINLEASQEALPENYTRS